MNALRTALTKRLRCVDSLRSFARRQRLRSLVLASVLMGSTFLRTNASAEMAAAPKMFVRSRVGYATNQTNHKKNPVLGGFGVLAHMFLWPWLSTGVGYHADFDPTLGLVPIQGLLVQGRFYFYGTGSHQELGAGSGGEYRKFHSTFALYGLGEFTRGSYNLTVSGGLQAGNFALVNFGLGADYRLSRHLELNTEISQTALGLSSDPTTLRLSLRVLTFGLGYIF